ncbi:Hypothetical protein A7982_10440 [Minicystis rosea]|nr:Hypothetical protein A7982_10440 [Minicystis rosea]
MPDPVAPPEPAVPPEPASAAVTHMPSRQTWLGSQPSGQPVVAVPPPHAKGVAAERRVRTESQ